MASILARNDEVVKVEPQVDRAVVRIAGLTLLIGRAGTDEAPAVSVEVWPDGGEGAAPVASLVVPAPADDRNCPEALWYRQR